MQKTKTKKGELAASSNKYQHECSSSLPSEFAVLPTTESLIVFYECPNDVTPLYALLSSSDLQITPLSVSFDQPNPSLTQWKFEQNPQSLNYLQNIVNYMMLQ